MLTKIQHYLYHEAVPAPWGQHLVTVSRVTKILLLGPGVPSQYRLRTGSCAGNAAEALAPMDALEHHHNHITASRV